MFQNQSWFSNQQSSKVNSPATSRQLKTCLSFASIKHHKILQQVQTPRHSVTKIAPLARTGEKEKLNKDLKRPKQKQRKKKQDEQFDIKSIKNNQNLVVQSYQIQNQSLKATVQILKQQVSVINSNYQILKRQNKRIKQQSQQNIIKINKLKQQIQQFQKKERQYNEIMPKIQELEELQDRMIQENGRYKDRQNLLKGLLAQILILTSSGTQSIAIQVKNLINQQFNRLP